MQLNRYTCSKYLQQLRLISTSFSTTSIKKINIFYKKENITVKMLCNIYVTKDCDNVKSLKFNNIALENAISDSLIILHWYCVKESET